MKTFNKIIFALFIFVFVANVQAQTNDNYKNQFPKNKVAETVYHYSSINAKAGALTKTEVGNYKNQFHNFTETFNKVVNPVCCTNNIALHNNDYKHPYSLSSEKSCELGVVCKAETELSCCK